MLVVESSRKDQSASSGLVKLDTTFNDCISVMTVTDILLCKIKVKLFNIN